MGIDKRENRPGAVPTTPRAAPGGLRPKRCCRAFGAGNVVARHLDQLSRFIGASAPSPCPRTPLGTTPRGRASIFDPRANRSTRCMPAGCSTSGRAGAAPFSVILGGSGAWQIERPAGVARHRHRAVEAAPARTSSICSGARWPSPPRTLEGSHPHDAQLGCRNAHVIRRRGDDDWLRPAVRVLSARLN